VPGTVMAAVCPRFLIINTMASFQAIAATGNTIRNLLADASPRHVFPGAEFKLFQTANLVSPPFTDLGISIYLYRVTYNATRRNLPPRRRLNGDCFKPSVPLDLHFLVTAWAKAPEQQWALLAWAIRAIEDTPVLPAGLLNQNAGSHPDGTLRNVFDEDESVELVGENLSLQDTTNIWEIARHSQQPSVSVVARSVLIDSLVDMPTGKPVQTRAFDLATRSS
jgi:Pvc16 N-terminal domain